MSAFKHNQLQLVDKDEIDDEEEFQMIDYLTDHGIDDGDVEKLNDAGIYFCHDLMMQNLIGIEGLSEAKFDKIREAAEKIVNYGYITGSDALIKIMEAEVGAVHGLENKIKDYYKILENKDMVLRLRDGGQKIKEQIAKLNLDKESRERYISTFKNLATGPSSPRFFVGHSIYKGTAALTVEPRAPKFTPLDSGSFKLSREGFVLLQFAPAASVRQYDWSRKQVFSLSVTEIGTVMSLCAKDSCEFFHDPFKGKSDEGKFRKVLKVEPLADGSGHFFNLSVQNMLANMDESIYIPVTRAELTVLVSAFNFLIPYLLGWHAYANSIKADD